MANVVFPIDTEAGENLRYGLRVVYPARESSLLFLVFRRVSIIHCGALEMLFAGMTTDCGGLLWSSLLLLHARWNGTWVFITNASTEIPHSSLWRIQDSLSLNRLIALIWRRFWHLYLLLLAICCTLHAVHATLVKAFIHSFQISVSQISQFSNFAQFGRNPWNQDEYEIINL